MDPSMPPSFVSALKDKASSIASWKVGTSNSGFFSNRARNCCLIWLIIATLSSLSPYLERDDEVNETALLHNQGDACRSVSVKTSAMAFLEVPNAKKESPARCRTSLRMKITASQTHQGSKQAYS
jgi:hypothetical protein